MERSYKMRALMSLKAIPGRSAVKRGEEYKATAQEARDDMLMDRAVQVSVMRDGAAAPAKAAKADGK